MVYTTSTDHGHNHTYEKGDEATSIDSDHNHPIFWKNGEATIGAGGRDEHTHEKDPDNPGYHGPKRKMNANY